MVGDKIREFRTLKGISLSQLAKVANVSKGYLSDVEKNVKSNPSTEFLEKIANALEINMSELFSDNSSKLDLFEDDDMKLMFSKAQKMSKENRKKVLKMMEIFEEENNR